MVMEKVPSPAPGSIAVKLSRDKMSMLVKIIDIKAIIEGKSTLPPCDSQEAFVWTVTMFALCSVCDLMTCVIWLIATTCLMFMT